MRDVGTSGSREREFFKLWPDNVDLLHKPLISICRFPKARVTKMRERQTGECWRDNGKVRLQPLLNPSLRHGKMQSLFSSLICLLHTMWGDRGRRMRKAPDPWDGRPSTDVGSFTLQPGSKLNNQLEPPHSFSRQGLSLRCFSTSRFM